MGLFVSEDRNYDESVRQVGFNRYKQLLSAHFGDWFKVNLLTILGALPLAAGIVFSILSSSVLVLIPSALVGGMIFGPFLAGMYDAVLRGMRDDPHHWWENYRRSWKQNFRSSLLPGAILGLFLGMYAFMGMLFWWAETPPTAGTIVLYLVSGSALLLICTLYWPQMVLFEQRTVDRIRNMILFTTKYLWKMLGVSLLQMGYWGIYVLFAPWTLLLIPIFGVWYIVFLSLHLIYDPLNTELEIEDRIQAAEQEYK